MGNEIAALDPVRIYNSCGKFKLNESAELVQMARVIVSNDTGLMHIAAASGTPSLGLFGPSPAAQYAPWGRHTACAQSADLPEAMFGPGFDHRTTDTLMDGLSVDAAEAAADKLWRSIASDAA